MFSLIVEVWDVVPLVIIMMMVWIRIPRFAPIILAIPTFAAGTVMSGGKVVPSLIFSATTMGFPLVISGRIFLRVAAFRRFGMDTTHYSDQDLLKMAFRSGEYRRQQGLDAQPLNYVINCAEYFARHRPEAFYGQIFEWYQAGYNGLTLVPAQWQ